MPYHLCHLCGKHLSRKQTLDKHIAFYHEGEGLKQCQAGGHLAKIAPEKKRSAGVSGVAGFTDSTANRNPFRDNHERVQPKPQPPLPDPLANSLSSLDQTMHAILQNRTVGDDYVKAQIYSQALKRYLRRAEQFRERPRGKMTLNENESAAKAKPERDVSYIKSLLRATLPESFIKGGTSLADAMDNLPGISWDDKLQLIVDGKTVENSNIVGLLSDLSRKKKTSKPPKGMEELLGVFKERNIPKSLIINEARRSALTGIPQASPAASGKIKSKLRTAWSEKRYKNVV